MQDQAAKVNARRLLLKSAYMSCYRGGISRWEWELDEQVIEIARKAGIENELDHISKLGSDGYKP